MSNFLYIGKFFHRKGKELNLLEKKIGITNNLATREYELNRTKSPIGYVIVSAWDVGDNAKKIERQIHALLNHDHSHGEWFEDDDDDLTARVTKFMQIENCGEVSLDESEDKDANTARKVEKDHTDTVALREDIACLKDIPFHADRYGEKVTVTMKDDGEFFCEQNGKTYPTFNSAFTNAGRALTGRDIFTINIWTGVRDDNGNTPDEVLKNKAKTLQG